MPTNAKHEEAPEKARDLDDIEQGEVEVIAPEEFFDDVTVIGD